MIERDRHSRLTAEVERRVRLRNWAAWMRKPNEVGLGDTVLRLKIAAQKRRLPEIHAALAEILAVCSCSDSEAAKRLNEFFPF